MKNATVSDTKVSLTGSHVQSAKAIRAHLQRASGRATGHQQSRASAQAATRRDLPGHHRRRLRSGIGARAIGLTLCLHIRVVSFALSSRLGCVISAFRPPAVAGPGQAFRSASRKAP